MRAPTHVRLASEKDFAGAVSELTRACRLMRAVHARTGLPPLRDYPAGLEGLARIVVGQQLSAQSAGAIWARLQDGVRPFEASAVLSFGDSDLKAFGLSHGKIRTLRSLATAVAAGEIEFRRLNRLSNEDIHETLTALHGIGPWTADIYLLFALRRADAFAPGDLALQIAAQRLFKLEARPSAARLLELAERWRPWRGAAARLLWADYALPR